MDYPKMPQVGTILPSQNATAKYKWVRNGEGSAQMNQGDILKLDPAAASNVLGDYMHVLLATDDDDDTVVGVVPLNYNSIVAGGTFPMQVSGLCTVVKVDGTTDVVNGDDISADAADGVGKKSAGLATRMGIFVDDNYATDAVAAKKVMLQPPFRVDPD